MISKISTRGILPLIQTSNTVTREVRQLQLTKFYQALDTWEHILSDEDRVGANVNRERELDEEVDHRVPLLHEWKHVPRATPEAACLSFLFSLPPVALDQIPVEDSKCSVCMEEYTDERIAKKLPCEHLVCSSCIGKWLCPWEENDRNTCPHCRMVFFTKMADIESVAGLQARCDAADWAQKHQVEVPALEGVKTYQLILLGCYVDEARVETERVSRSSILLSPAFFKPAIIGNAELTYFLFRRSECLGTQLERRCPLPWSGNWSFRNFTWKAMLIYLKMSQEAKLAIIRGTPPQARRAVNKEREKELFQCMFDSWRILNEIVPGMIPSEMMSRQSELLRRNRNLHRNWILIDLPCGACGI